MTPKDHIEQLLRGELMSSPAQVAGPPLAEIRRRAHRRHRALAAVLATTLSAAAVVAGVSIIRVHAAERPITGLPLSGCGPALSSTGTTQQGWEGPTPHPANAASLSDLANRVHLLGEMKYSEFYAGVGMDTDTDRVTVWRKPSPEFDQEIAGLSGSERVVIQCAKYTLKDLLGVAEELQADDDHWQGRGLRLIRFGPRYDGSCVDVFVADPQRAQTELTARYPGAPLCFQQAAGGPGVPLNYPSGWPAGIPD